ncbi:UNVERIFIED_CONTAM: bacteriocin biosynthesis protein [Streptococcus canis]|uniref:Bacteriocin biosynthesis protein n=1 Tax=Streptococcus canis TaxID=1329 RepID=A0AAE4Q3M6_STRCB|nr:lantibiotic dehydratase C-terminal domain-containing protein [Streptococcus canis]MDV5976370.1 bacteriocin biosynthesis protein [Streptococcus canis]
MEEIEKWLSYHIFCHNPIHHDKIICTLNNWASKDDFACFFFIRYWEGGPHIRFRIKTANSSNKDYHKILSDLLHSELSFTDVILTKEQYYKGHKLDGKKIPMENLPWYGNNSIVSIPYVRENERYGGREVIEQAESVFYYSSQLVSKMLEDCMNCHIMIRILFYIYIYEQVKAAIIEKNFDFDYEQFYENCFSYWKKLYDLKGESYVSDAVTSIGRSFEGKEEKIETTFSFIQPEIRNLFITSLIEYLEEVRQLRGKKMMRSVLFSQMHMFANRLGIPIEYECAVYGYYHTKTSTTTSQKGV